jgi:hypothetical protein
VAMSDQRPRDRAHRVDVEISCGAIQPFWAGDQRCRGHGPVHFWSISATECSTAACHAQILRSHVDLTAPAGDGGQAATARRNDFPSLSKALYRLVAVKRKYTHRNVIFPLTHRVKIRQFVPVSTMPTTSSKRHEAHVGSGTGEASSWKTSGVKTSVACVQQPMMRVLSGRHTTAPKWRKF